MSNRYQDGEIEKELIFAYSMKKIFIFQKSSTLWTDTIKLLFQTSFGNIWKYFLVSHHFVQTLSPDYHTSC